MEDLNLLLVVRRHICFPYFGEFLKDMSLDLLFILYIIDFSQYLNPCNLFFSLVITVDFMIDWKIRGWASDNSLTINASKTKVIMFG